jgi:protein SCO1/2
MRKNHKIITTVLWSFLVLTMVAVVGRGMWAWQDPPLPVLFQTQPFSLTDQDGKPFGSEQLKGQAWVAAVIFTNCPGACPMMSQRLSKLQEAVPAKNVKLVSFTVDPERDTPEVLRQYGVRFNADGKRWHFLTGPKETMLATARGLNLTAIPAAETRPIQHDEHFLLVDGDGRVRGIYMSRDDEDMKRLTKDAAALARSM